MNEYSFSQQLNLNGSSEGEYSDEFTMASESSLSNSAESPLDLSDYLKDISIGANNELSGLPQPRDQDYVIANKNISSNNNDINNYSVDSIIFVASKINDEIESDYTLNRQKIISWIDWKSKNQSQDYLTHQIENVKKNYSELKNNLNFIAYASPSKSKLDGLSSIRNDIGKNRILFHFFGNRLSYKEGGDVLLMDGYPLEKIFSSILTPSFFVFDCGNSGEAIEYIKKVAESNKKLPRRKKGRFPIGLNEGATNWNDWICICSCDKDKQVPINPFLPIDFLGSCLLTPVTISILSHILQFYRCSFPDEQFPLKYLSSVLMYDKSSNLEFLLSTLVSSIAVDYLPLDLFFQLFKKDPLVSKLFERFILFQYLLKQYSMSPSSYPEIPNMSRHSFWLHWQLAIDNTLNNILTSKPSFSNDFFHQAFSAFVLYQNEKLSSNIPISFIHVISKHLMDKYSMNNKQEGNNQMRIPKKSASLIHKSDLSNSLSSPRSDFLLYAHSPNNNRSGSFYHEKSYENIHEFITNHSQEVNISKEIKYDNCENAWITLSNFAHEKEINRMHLSYLFSFSDLFSCMFNNIDKKEYFDYICYLTALTLIYNQRAGNFISTKEFDLTKLLVLIFNKDYKTNTRIYILIILSSLNKYIHQIRNNFRDEGFLQNFRKLIYQSKPKLQVWLMIAFKRAFGFNSLPYSIYKSSSVYLQICELTYHKSFEVRSSALLALSIFFQSKQHPIHKFILKNIISLFYDVSFYVRYQLLFIIIRYLTTFSNGNIDYFQFRNIQDFYQKAGFEIVQNVFLKNLDEPDIDESEFIKILNSILLHFCSDPHPSIQQLANDFKKQKFLSYLPRFDSSQCNDFLDISFYDSEIAHYDSEPLYQLSSNQMMRTYNHNKTSEKNDFGYQKRAKFEHIKAKFVGYCPNKKVQFPSIRKAVFHDNSTNMAVSTSDGFVFELDDSLSVTSKIQITKYEISQISTLNSMIFVSSNDGSIHMWNPDNSKASISFKADVSNINDSLSPQLFSVNRFNSKIATARSDNGIYLWDIETQQIVSNWNVTSNISTLSIHSNDPQIILAGFEKGNIFAYDCRQPNSIQILSEINELKNDSIVNIVGNRNGSNLMYACSKKGNTLIWNGVTNKTRIIRNPPNQDKHIISFDIHSYLPFLLYSDATESPHMNRYDGTTLCRFNDIPPKCPLTSHPSEPLISFINPSTELLQIYQINSFCA